MGKTSKNIEDKIKMAQPFNTLDDATRSQMACTFAALMLYDDGSEVNAGSLKKVVEASGVKVAPYWPMLFAQALNGQDIGSFLAVSSGSAPVQATTGGDVAAPKEEAKKEEVVEEEEEDMDLGDLFG